MQTGLEEIEGVYAVVPEGRFNGKDDAPTRIAGSALKPFVALGPWDWMHYDGNWDETGSVPSPTIQQRFLNPLTGKRRCTRRWEGYIGESPCDEKGFSGRARNSARLQALAAQATGTVDPCEDWFGPMVQVSACQPAGLRAAIEQGRLGEDGSLRLIGAQGQADTAIGVAQSVGDPLTLGRPVQVFGEGEPADIRVRVQTPHEAIDARFNDVALTLQSPLMVAVTRGGTVRATTAQGLRLRPAGLRRTDLRRPHRIRQASARRRAGLVVVRFSKVSGQVSIQLLPSRRGRSLRAVQVTGQRGRAILRGATSQARYVAVRRLSRGGIPGAARVIIIR